MCGCCSGSSWKLRPDVGASLRRVLGGRLPEGHRARSQEHQGWGALREHLKGLFSGREAYWRAARASLQLDLCRNGLEFCEAGLLQAPGDADLQKLRASCAEKLSGQQQRRKAQEALATRDFNADEAMAVQDKVNELNEQLARLKADLLEPRKAWESDGKDSEMDGPREFRAAWKPAAGLTIWQAAAESTAGADPTAPWRWQ